MFRRFEGANILEPRATFDGERNGEATFMNSRLRLSAAIALAAGMFAGSPAFAVEPGRPAPSFDLPLMDGAGRAGSGEIFSSTSTRSSSSGVRVALTASNRFSAANGSIGYTAARTSPFSGSTPTTATGSRRAA